MTAPNGAESAQVIQPQPVPFSYDFHAEKASDGTDLVRISLFLVTGATHVWLAASDAKEMAAKLERIATRSQTGLILPPGVG